MKTGTSRVLARGAGGGRARSGRSGSGVGRGANMVDLEWSVGSEGGLERDERCGVACEECRATDARVSRGDAVGSRGGPRVQLG
jgi:hypothetical protein